jgi:subtilisin family serine protease
MNRNCSGLALLLVLALAACSPDVIAPVKAPMSPTLSMGVSPESGTYIVRLNGRKTASAFAAQVAAVGGTVRSYHEGAGFAVISGLSGAGASGLASGGVGDMLPDFVFAPDDPNTASQADASEVADVSIQSQTNPAGAARFGYQWNMRLIGAPEAWAAGKLGSSDVTVAILDTGIDYDAPDLNGLVDLDPARSVSFMNHFVGVRDNPDTPEDEYTPIIPADDQIAALFFPSRNKITDFNGHGTNVASQVSSKAFALSGVTSKTTLIAVKVLGANGYGSFSDILDGVVWAADHGADVANMSLGGGFSKAANGQGVAMINQAFNYAKRKGMLIVVSAGNSSIDLQHNGNAYATYCDAPHVICVSAVGPTLATSENLDEPAFYTNFGKNSVDIAAPGGNADAANGFTPSRWPWTAPAPAPFTVNDIASWIWAYCAKQKLVIVKNADGINGDLFLTACIAGNRIFPYIGTSQAAPHVAGLAALLIAENGKGNPQQIKRLIQKSADPIDAAYGRGRISVKNALGL